MNQRLVAMVLPLALLASSCATQGVPRAEATRVPPDRLLAFTDRKDGYASVVVTRDAGLMGGGCFIGLVISGTLAARFDPAETAEFFVPPGETDMAVVRDPQGRGMCSMGAWNPVPEHYTLKKDGLNLFRISLGPFRRPRLLPAVY
jgi:hypothetical protein